MYKNGKLKLGGKFAHLQDTEAWDVFCKGLSEMEWVSFIQPPPTKSCSAEHVVHYLARYLTGGPTKCDGTKMKPKPVILAIFTVMFAAVPGCGRVYMISGIVVDGDGNPISGASIYLFPHGLEHQLLGRANGTSEDSGEFEAGYGTSSGIKFFEMVVSRKGYREHEQLVEARPQSSPSFADLERHPQDDS